MCMFGLVVCWRRVICIGIIANICIWLSCGNTDGSQFNNRTEGFTTILLRLNVQRSQETHGSRHNRN